MVRIVSLLLLFFTACGPRYVDYFTHHDDGTPKPKVIFAPVKISCVAPADTAEAIESTIRYELMDTGELFLYRASDVKEMGNLDICKKEYKFQGNCDADYLVMVEIFEHGLRNQGNQCIKVSSDIKARIKVVDLRRCPQKTVMYELVDVICTASIGCGEPDLAPFKSAHLKLASKISKRLECAMGCY